MPGDPVPDIWSDGKMVGAVRFELTTSCAQGRRANQVTLRPDQEAGRLLPIPGDGEHFFVAFEMPGPRTIAMPARRGDSNPVAPIIFPPDSSIFDSGHVRR